MIAVFDFILLFALWVLRGLYLWLLVPITFVGWIFIHSWAQKASYGACLGWYDWNIFAFLATGLIGARLDKYVRRFQPVELAEMSAISHRVGRMRQTLQNLESDPLQSRHGMGSES